MDSTSAAALYAATGAVLVALIGLAGNLIVARYRTKPEPDPQVDESADAPTLVAALGAAYADNERLRQRGDRWKERAIACEARESTRPPAQRQPDGTAP